MSATVTVTTITTRMKNSSTQRFVLTDHRPLSTASSNMNRALRLKVFSLFRVLLISSLLFCQPGTPAQEPQQQNRPRASVDGTAAAGQGWKSLGEQDFVNVNGQPETWNWKDDLLSCTGQPIGVLRTRQVFTNFEMVIEWRHLRSGGNSGIFVWVPEEALKDLKPDALPQYGIEVQALDHGYTEQYEKRTGRKGDWFTTHGDVFPVGKSKMKVFSPTSPNGSRSFPRKQLSKGVREWNHYYIRGINGEVRLWVNGEEVSGGNGSEPQTGYLCLESEGSPIEFKNIRIRELP